MSVSVVSFKFLFSPFHPVNSGLLEGSFEVLNRAPPTVQVSQQLEASATYQQLSVFPPNLVPSLASEARKLTLTSHLLVVIWKCCEDGSAVHHHSSVSGHQHLPASSCTRERWVELRVCSPPLGHPSLSRSTHMPSPSRKSRPMLWAVVQPTSSSWQAYLPIKDYPLCRGILLYTSVLIYSEVPVLLFLYCLGLNSLEPSDPARDIIWMHLLRVHLCFCDSW